MMLSIGKLTLLTILISFWLVGGSGLCSAQGLKTGSEANQAAAISAAAKENYASTCAGCHGLDGRGTERAPNIATNPEVAGLSDDQLSNIISNGIGGTGMPAFRSLTSVELRSLVSYIRSLQGSGETRVIPGNAGRGEAIFFGKGECSRCHAVAGKGGFIGPDLTAYAASFSTETILDAIVNSSRIVPVGYRLAVATTKDGSRMEGVLRNEDNFSVQLQAEDGSFHFYQKSDLQNLEHVSRPIMPTNYRDRLSRDELNDLVNYLVNASSKNSSAPNDKKEDEE